MTRSPWAPGPGWYWVGEPRADRLRREGVVTSVVAGVAGVVTFVLILLLHRRLPSSNPLSDFYLIFGLLAPIALLATSVGGLFVLRWVRDGFVRGDGASRLKAGPVVGAVGALLALIGTAIFGLSSLATLPALVILVGVAVRRLDQFRGMDA